VRSGTGTGSSPHEFGVGEHEKAKHLLGLRRKLARAADTSAAGSATAGAASAGEVQEQDRLKAGLQTKPIVYRRDVPRLEPRRVPEGGGICIPLERCIEGREAASAGGRAFYLVERSLSEDEPQLHGRLARAVEALAARPADAALAPPPASVEQLLFLDLETTGLGTSPVFLIGTLACRGRELVVRQFLARTYAEEPAILSSVAEELARRPLCVSFNGKSFDVPYLRVRAAATGVPVPEPRHHLDLLHAARRAFGRSVPDCRLQTLERTVCGRRRRSDDIASHDIPRAYHDFVRTGDARELAQIMQHNLHDLVTMAHLMALMIGEDVKRET
jgi:uncharacterized protein YprB with RNaseH-like and TPR domain